jgi:hypothetical protein
MGSSTAVAGKSLMAGLKLELELVASMGLELLPPMGMGL